VAAPAVVDQISELSTLMKTVYGPRVEQQQNLAAMMYKKLSTSTVRFGGNDWQFPARMVNTQSVGARGYRVSLPEPILNIDVTARVRHKFLYGTFDIAGPDIEKGKGNVNAFVNSLTDKMSSLVDMTLKDMNMQTYLDGTGVRATLSGAGAAGVLPVDQVKFLRVGMQVNIVSGVDGATLRGGTAGDSDASDTAGTYFQKRFTIIAINPATPSITVAAGAPLAAVQPTSAATGDFVIRHKAIGSELTGLAAINDDGVNNAGANVLQDIDRAANPLWRAKVFSSATGPRDLTLQLLQQAIDIPEIVSGRRVNMLVGSYNARDRYLQLLVPQKRFTDLKMDGGFQVLEYNGRDFLVDVDCPDDTVHLLSRETIQKFGLFDLQFVEQTGGILKHDSLSAGDVFYGFLRAICNFGTTQANGNAKVVSITVDAGYLTSQ
jgi:hypothetical protein